jgi:hypothetical protein
MARDNNSTVISRLTPRTRYTFPPPANKNVTPLCYAFGNVDEGGIRGDDEVQLGNDCQAAKYTKNGHTQPPKRRIPTE